MGADFLAARELIEGELVIIPSAAVKADENILLVGMTLFDLERQIGLPLRALDFNSFAATLS